MNEFSRMSYAMLTILLPSYRFDAIHAEDRSDRRAATRCVAQIERELKKR